MYSHPINWYRCISLAATIFGLFAVCFVCGCSPFHLQSPISFNPTTTTTTPIRPTTPLTSTLSLSTKNVGWAIPIIALGAVAIFLGASKLGICAIIYGGLSLCLSNSIAALAPYWPIIAVVGFVGIIGVVVFMVLQKTKALKQIITGVQEIRDTGEVITKKHVDAILNETQDDSTKQIVAKTKLNGNGK